MTTCAICYPATCPECCCGTAEGERRKLDAFVVLTATREAVIRRAQRALLKVILKTGSATADDVRRWVELPQGVNAKCFGAAPGPLARAKIIRADGFAKTCRPVGHARPVTVWTLADRSKALRWLADHPDLPHHVDKSEAVAGSQGLLFDPQENATPTAGPVGAA